jgi:glyoxylase-like metal-dependent hydrolase (beta-lactamase superfamily II)
MSRTLQHKRREPAPGVFRLTLPLPFPGLDEVNAYVLDDAGDVTLVDTGLYLPDDEADHGWEHIVRALAAFDREPADISRLIVTHTHIDHYGMAGRLKEETGCEIWIQKEGADELDHYRGPEKYAAELRETYMDHGISPEESEELTKYEDWRPFVHSVVEADRWLDGDESVRIGDRDWEFVHTPGHARSHVCLWNERDSLFVSGDHLLGSITPHIDYRRGAGDALGDYLESLRKVEKLTPHIVLPGHGRPFEDGAERARATARHHDRRLGAILQVVRRRACTANEITDEIFGGTLLHFQKRLALGEALAHLHYLRLRGEIERVETEEGTRLYRKKSRRPPQEVDG